MKASALIEQLKTIPPDTDVVGACWLRNRYQGPTDEEWREWMRRLFAQTDRDYPPAAWILLPMDQP